jgi:hypothetical protein
MFIGADSGNRGTFSGTGAIQGVGISGRVYDYFFKIEFNASDHFM